jgi:hypothetical protein
MLEDQFAPIHAVNQGLDEGIFNAQNTAAENQEQKVR